MKGQPNHIAFKNSVSDTTTHEQDMSSDADSDMTSSFPRKFGFLGNELIRMEEGDRNHTSVKRVFLTGIGDLRRHATVVAIHRNAHSSLPGKARVQAFKIYTDAMKKKSGDVNMKYAWYASSMAGICGIFRYGFSKCESPENGGLYGCGLYLTPAGSSIESLVSSIADEDGLRHLLLCRVVLGNQEEVLPGSKQFHPSSEEFDSGVDNRLAPKKFVVWSTHMNTHVLPEFIISFTVPSNFPKGSQRMAEPVIMPRSPWIPLPILTSVLSGALPPPTINLIEKYNSDYLKRKITRDDLVRRLRQTVGDKLLKAAIRSYRAKLSKAILAEKTKKHKV